MFVLSFFLHSILFAGSALDSFQCLRSLLIVSFHVFFGLPRPCCPTTSNSVILLIQPSFLTTFLSLKIFDDDISNLRDHGYDIDADGMEFKLYANVKGYIMDKKASNLYTSLGGCYCDHCSYSKLDCVNKEIIAEGFLINGILLIFMQYLTSWSKRTERYSNPKMIIQCTKESQQNQLQIVISQQVLHELFRTFDHYMKIAVHIKAGIFDWSESKTSVNNQFLKHVKQEIRTRIHNDIHGTEGTSLTPQEKEVQPCRETQHEIYYTRRKIVL